MMIWKTIKKKYHFMEGKRREYFWNISGVKRKSSEKNQWKRSRGKKETMSHVCVWRWSSFKHIVPVTAAEHLWWIAWKENDSSASVFPASATPTYSHCLYLLPSHFLLLPLQSTYYYMHNTNTHIPDGVRSSATLPRLHNHQKVINQMRGWCEEKTNHLRRSVYARS